MAGVGVEHTSFVGREEELAALDDAGEVVVVTGPAGVGKSRLVGRWVESMGRATARADLGAARDLEDALRRVARALSLRFGPGDGDRVERVVERVGEVLASRAPIVLWLDDADAVVQSLGDAVTAWRERGVTIALTSRRARARR